MYKNDEIIDYTRKVIALWPSLADGFYPFNFFNKFKLWKYELEEEFRNRATTEECRRAENQGHPILYGMVCLGFTDEMLGEVKANQHLLENDIFEKIVLAGTPKDAEALLKKIGGVHFVKPHPLALRSWVYHHPRRSELLFMEDWLPTIVKNCALRSLDEKITVDKPSFWNKISKKLYDDENIDITSGQVVQAWMIAAAPEEKARLDLIFSSQSNLAPLVAARPIDPEKIRPVNDAVTDFIESTQGRNKSESSRVGWGKAKPDLWRPGGGSGR